MPARLVDILCHYHHYLWPMILRPESWPETIQFLCDEQDRLERLPSIRGGLQTDAEEIDVLCLKYATTHNWPTTFSEHDRSAIFQRFLWAKAFCASLSHTFRKADGTETGRMPYPNWEFEAMMIWLLVELWPLRESIQEDGTHPLPPRPAPQWPPGPEAS